jgi:hypothetical protein
MVSLNFLSELSAGGHQALAVFIIVSYATISFVSVHSQSQRHKYHNLTLRAVSLLREAARSSLRADKGGDAADVYADVCKSRIYISAIDRLLTSEEVAKLTGVSLDELRAHIDMQLANARTALTKTDKHTTYAAHAPFSHQQYSHHHVNASEPISAFTRGPSMRLEAK